MQVMISNLPKAMEIANGRAWTGYHHVVHHGCPWSSHSGVFVQTTDKETDHFKDVEEATGLTLRAKKRLFGRDM